jgi:hypothetical protein
LYKKSIFKAPAIPKLTTISHAPTVIKAIVELVSGALYEKDTCIE